MDYTSLITSVGLPNLILLVGFFFWVKFQLKQNTEVIKELKETLISERKRSDAELKEIYEKLNKKVEETALNQMKEDLKDYIKILVEGIRTEIKDLKNK